MALFLSVSLKTVYRWYQSGIIEGVRLNRSIRIYRDSILKLAGIPGEAPEESEGGDGPEESGKAARETGNAPSQG